MWITSMGNHGAAVGISERRRSSYIMHYALFDLFHEIRLIYKNFFHKYKCNLEFDDFQFWYLWTCVGTI